MNTRSLLCALFSLFLSTCAFTQKERRFTHQDLGWFRLYHHTNFGTQWLWRCEVEERSFIFPQAQHQFMVRNHLSHNLGSGWSAALGFTYFIQTLPQDPDAITSYSRPELRPQQELAHRRQLSGRFSLSQRYWLEERLQQNIDADGQRHAGYQFSLRFRYLLQGQLTLISRPTSKGRLHLNVFDEAFFNLGETGPTPFSLNLLGASLSYGLTPALGLEVGYINWFQPRNIAGAYYQRDIVRVTVHHYWKVRRKGAGDF
ncbi:MAG: DUF2490 domain-containing protein [Phaeodactylibacter sp.]|nr:DUF2490 domain-containing protein [Phaeodactylibacter sp.]MCB9053478.1 DUF2490 domain-containing protein [Lewinellaceae bacterium]